MSLTWTSKEIAEIKTLFPTAASALSVAPYSWDSGQGVFAVAMKLSDKRAPAISTLLAFYKGRLARKTVFKCHQKDRIMKEAHDRLTSRLSHLKTLEERVVELERENLELVKENTVMKDTFSSNLQQEVEQLLHIRQIHHLRKSKN